MTDTYRLYLKLVDGLRARRADVGWEPEDDRAELLVLAELFEKLSPPEQRIANAEGWRSWPDLYDAHMEATLTEPVALAPDDVTPARLAA
jgi:hypothetical protein